jgi:hypothetical protein
MGVARGKSAKGPTAVTVYRAMDGTIFHTRCHQALSYQGPNAGALELHFHCAKCHERVMLPELVVAGLPVITSGAA